MTHESKPTPGELGEQAARADNARARKLEAGPSVLRRVSEENPGCPEVVNFVQDFLDNNPDVAF